MAWTSSGALLVNVTHIASEEDLVGALTAARLTGRRFFLGVELTKEEQAEAEARLDEAAAEVVATVYRERR